MRHEVWFDKVLWSYMPCHWKGWAIMAAIGIPTTLAVLLAESTFDALGYANADWIPAPIIILPAFIWLMRIADRPSQ